MRYRAEIEYSALLLRSGQIKAVVADPHPNIDVYVNDRDISFLKIILEVSGLA